MNKNLQNISDPSGKIELILSLVRGNTININLTSIVRNYIKFSKKKFIVLIKLEEFEPEREKGMCHIYKHQSLCLFCQDVIVLWQDTFDSFTPKQSSECFLNPPCGCLHPGKELACEECSHLEACLSHGHCSAQKITAAPHEKAGRSSPGHWATLFITVSQTFPLIVFRYVILGDEN